jgi:hypothetical protein
VCEYFSRNAEDTNQNKQAQQLLKSIQGQIERFMGGKEIVSEQADEEEEVEEEGVNGHEEEDFYLEDAQGHDEEENPLSMLWNNEDFCEKMATLINSHIDPNHVEELKPLEITFEPIINEISQDGEILHALDSALGRIIQERQNSSNVDKEGTSLSSFSKKRKRNSEDENQSRNVSACGLEVGDGYSNCDVFDADPEDAPSERSYSANFAPINFSNEGRAVPGPSLDQVYSSKTKTKASASPQPNPAEKKSSAASLVPQKELLKQAKIKVQSADFDLDKFLDSLHN